MTHDKAAEFEKVTFFGCNIYGNITYSSFGVEFNKKVLNSLNFQALLWGKKNEGHVWQWAKVYAE